MEQLSAHREVGRILSSLQRFCEQRLPNIAPKSSFTKFDDLLSAAAGKDQGVNPGVVNAAAAKLQQIEDGCFSGQDERDSMYEDACCAILICCCGSALRADYLCRSEDVGAAIERFCAAAYLLARLEHSPWESWLAQKREAANISEDILAEVVWHYEEWCKETDRPLEFDKEIIDVIAGNELSIDQHAVSNEREILEQFVTSEGGIEAPQHVLAALRCAAADAMLVSCCVRENSDLGYVLLHITDAANVAGVLTGRKWGMFTLQQRTRVERSRRLLDAKHRETREFKKVAKEHYQLHRRQLDAAGKPMFATDKDWAKHVAKNVIPANWESIYKYWIPEWKAAEK